MKFFHYLDRHSAIMSASTDDCRTQVLKFYHYLNCHSARCLPELLITAEPDEARSDVCQKLINYRTQMCQPDKTRQVSAEQRYQSNTHVKIIAIFNSANTL